MHLSSALHRRIAISVLSIPVLFLVACGGSGGEITTFAGKNIAGFQGDGAAATNALINVPSGVAVSSSGDVYIADTGNNRIRKVSGGNISTVAGNGNPGYSGDGGAATSASLNQPVGVAVDSGGNLYIADEANHAVRKVDTSGVITTIAGNGHAGYNGDNIPASTAQINLPADVAIDSSGNIFISDSGNNRIREIVASSGLIQTVAGTGVAGNGGASGPATSAQLSAPEHIAIASSGDLYIVDSGNNVVHKVSSGTISTVIGNGTAGDTGDGKSPTDATLSNPSGIAVDSAGNLYVSDPVHNRVRKVSNGSIEAYAGNGVGGYTGDGSRATSAELNGPQGLAIDSNGSLYIADARNQVIRKVN